MSANSNIEWTDATWNPVRGCSKVSPGCKHCYAETFANRWKGIKGHPYEQGFELRLVPERLIDPLKWFIPKKIFVNSMSDLFHEKVPDDYIYKVFKIMSLADWHIYQILTKRPERMKLLSETILKEFSKLKHIWIGVSVEDKKHGCPRIELLRKANVATRFLSIEPLLEDIGKINLSKINWVIVGGESGPGSRPIEEDWVVSIKDQCQSLEIPFFFKQWGGVHKKENGRRLQRKLYDEFPLLKMNKVPSKQVASSKAETAFAFI